MGKFVMNGITLPYHNLHYTFGAWGMGEYTGESMYIHAHSYRNSFLVDSHKLWHHLVHAHITHTTVSI